MKVNPYLIFNGQCEAAFAYYAECLGGKIESKMTFGNSPMAKRMPADWGDKILHAVLVLGDTVLMGSDAPPSQYEAPKGFSIALNIADIEEGERVFNALAKGGAVRMAFQKTFWAERYGDLVDPFGIPWIVNCAPAA